MPTGNYIRRSPKYEFLLESIKLHGASNECLLWPFSKSGNGYGVVGFNRENLYVHHVAYRVVFGPTTNKLFHSCENNNCYNYLHLKEGPEKTNYEFLVDTISKEMFNKDICLEWPFARTPANYGKLGKNNKVHVVSRLALELFLGKSIGPLHACHSCDNPPCFNPYHLFPGTRKENMKDCKNKGRNKHGCVIGDANPNAIVTSGEVLSIRKLHSEGATIASLARMFGLTHSGATHIVKRHHWNNV